MDGRDHKRAASPDEESASLMANEPAQAATAAVPTDISSVSIDVAENGGFSVRVSYKQPPPKAGGNGGLSPSPYLEGKSYAFSSRGELYDFLAEHLGAPDAVAAPRAPLPAPLPAPTPAEIDEEEAMVRT